MSRRLRQPELQSVTVMGYYFLIFGSVVLTFAIWVTAKNLKLLLTGVRTQGLVVGVDEKLRRGSDGGKKMVYFHPVIAFETEQGHEFQFTFGSGSTRKRPTIGDQVTVIYEVDRPDKATLNSFMGLWAGPLAAFLLAGGGLYGGIQIVFDGVK